MANHRTHPDPGFVDSKELSYQVAEINSLGCRVVEDQLLAVVLVLSVHQCHLKEVGGVDVSESRRVAGGGIGDFGETKTTSFFFILFLVEDLKNFALLGQPDYWFGEMERVRSLVLLLARAVVVQVFNQNAVHVMI